MAVVGRLVTTLAGQALARTFAGASAGPAGAVIGFALPMVARRLGPLGMAGMAVGAWAINRYMQKPTPPAPVVRQPIVTPPPIPMVVSD
ncbi:hypothetical protein [Sandarakinorhabdus sp. DWP1-3-1]|uniref:hypothetical protein n=1 Tax=Sandarakinorhabdus sp. DWP1-3-1 TaxID=2804627 RepID=UPI003CE948AB